MPIFKREPDPPFNQAAVTRPAAPVAASPAAAVPAPARAPDAAPAAAKAAAAEMPPARPAAAVVDGKTEITGNLKSSGNVLIAGRASGSASVRSRRS